MVFTVFAIFYLWAKCKIKFLLSLTKSLIGFENPANVLLQETCSGFQITALDLRIVPEASFDLINYSDRGL
jgi:hypothetical protein